MKPASHCRSLTATVLLASLLPSAAMAHPGHGVGQDFVAGVLHPLSGLDHVLMIVAVSAWSGAMSNQGRLVVAACLALFVAVGAVLPFAPVADAPLEAAIALTVLGSGLLLALGRRWPLAASATLAALFAMIHGFAHGAEGPAGSMVYVPGLALATGGLALGVSFLASQLQSQRRWLQCAGLLSAITGVALLA
jgi:urease accessory protein